MSIEYKFLKSEHGDIDSCHACWAKVPLALFQGTNTKRVSSIDGSAVFEARFLCELCASSLSGNANKYPEQYQYRDVMFTTMNAANAILKQLGKFDNTEEETTDYHEYITMDGTLLHEDEVIWREDFKNKSG